MIAVEKKIGRPPGETRARSVRTSIPSDDRGEVEENTLHHY